MLLITPITCLCFCLGFCYLGYCTELDLRPLEHELSEDTYESLNMSKAYKKFDLTELETLSRRFDDMWHYNTSARKHTYYWGWELLERSCYFIAFTYQSAFGEIRNYYHRRFLYDNTLEYEVGYLVHEIVWKYQMMLEIYQLVYKRYFQAQDRYFAPVSYLFYLYTTELEYSTSAIHLCNMLHEVERKYEGIKKRSLWEDDGDIQTTRPPANVFNVTIPQNIKDDYFQRKKDEKKKKEKAIKKERKKMEEMGVFLRTTPNRKPKKSFWPLHYGWSIEYW